MDADDRQGNNAGSGRSEEPNRDVAWRMTAARQIAEGYDHNRRLAALTVAGSVGAGLADRWSDLDLGVSTRVQAATVAERTGLFAPRLADH